MTAVAIPEIWTPKIWTPDAGWRPKSLKHFNKRIWRKAKEDALTQAITVNSSGIGVTTTAAAASVTITAPSAGDVIVAIWEGYSSSGMLSNTNPPVHTGSSFSLLGFEVYAAGTGTIDCWISTTTGTSGTTVTQLPVTAAGGQLVVLVVSGLSNNAGTVLDGHSSNGDLATSPQNTGNAVTTNANDLIIAPGFSRLSSASNVAFTAPGAPWTTPVNVAGSSSTQPRILNYQVVSSTGTYSLAQAFAPAGVINIRNSIWALKATPAVSGRSPCYRGASVAVMGRGRR